MVNGGTGIRGLALIALLAGGALLEAQVPTPNISSLQSSTEGDGCGGPTYGAAITAGTPIQQFCLYVNGNFGVLNNFETVTWIDAINGAVQLNFAQDPNQAGNQLVVFVPAYLYATAESATIVVSETPFGSFEVPPPPSLSNGVPFAVNPAMAQVASIPSGIVGVFYSQPFFMGGTGPFTVIFPAVTPAPPGLNANAGNSLSGVPSQMGIFPIAPNITDEWGNAFTPSEFITIFNPLVITTKALPNGTVNTAYTTTLMGTGGAGQYIWGASGLPPGLSLNAGSGVISGTPPQSGISTVTVTLSDTVGDTATPVVLSLTIGVPGLVITTNALPNGTVSTAYTATLTGTGGAGQYIWGASGLPPGLSVNAGSGVISGTPTQSGTSSVTVTLSDTMGHTATPVVLSLTIVPALVITTNALPNGTVNTAYTATLVGTGGSGQYTWSASGLPPGLSVNAGSGVISGTPTQSGTSTVTVTLSDTTGHTATPAVLSLTIVPALVITTNALPNGRIQTAYSATLVGTGGSGQYAWGAAGLPPGLSVNAGSGVISGTPTQSGTSTVTVTLSDTTGHTAAPARLSLTIVPALVILTTGIPAGTTNAPYGAALSGSGGIPPYTWSVAGLPSGLSVNASTGVISGTPTQSGSFTVSVTLTDSGRVTANAQFGVTISTPPPPPVQIVGPLPDGKVGIGYSAVIGVTGGNGGPYSFSASGSLPPGLQVSNTGLLQGIPTAPGSFSFGVNVSDTAGNSGSGRLSVNIAPAALVITTGPLSSVQVGSAVAVTFAATGGVPPLVFSLSGSAPSGTSFGSNGNLSGTVSTAGSYSFTVTVTDSVKTAVSKGYTLVVTTAPLTIATANLPNGQAGTAYAGQFAAAGGTPPYTWSGSAAGGLSVSSSGAVFGTPTAAGTYSVSVTVADSAGTKVVGSFSVTVNPSSLAVTTLSLPNGALTSAYSASLSATGGTPPYTWSAGGLPTGITVSSSGVLSGTPTSPGAFTVDATVKDSTGTSASANLGLTILQAPLKITTTGISPPTLGTSFSLGFGATGGTPPYTWSATGLPAGVTITPTGTLGGTPTALGTSPITVNVTDSNGQKASETVNLTVILPSAPAVVFTGLPATANPATQSTASVTFNAPYPVDVTVNLTLTFTPLSGADDPNIQFSTGGRTATVTIKAGATASTASIGVQTGTVAGTITITAQLLASGQDITPVPAPVKTIAIAPSAPSITSVTAPRNSTGFTVTVVGFDTTRAVTQAVFTFTAAAGSTLQTTSAAVPVAPLFSSWFQSSASAPYGGQFSFAIPFTATGNLQSIASVTVTLVNPTGTSNAVTANLQ